MERYIIFDVTKGTGLGHNLRNIQIYAQYADTWNRTLAIDMRDFGYFKENEHQQFFFNFEVIKPPALRITTDLKLIDSLYNHPDRRVVNFDVPISNEDIDIPILYVPGKSAENLYKKEGKVSDYRIALRGPLKEHVSRSLSSNFGPGKVIGVHFRHGNGEFLHARFDSVKSSGYQQKLQEIKNEYVRIISGLLGKAEFKSAKIFVASDNKEFIKFIKESFHQAFSIVETLPDIPFLAFLKSSNYDFSVLQDAVLDIWALSHCDYLVCTSSLFTEFAIENSTILERKNVFVIHKHSVFDLLDERNEPKDIGDAIETLRVAAKKMPDFIKVKERLAYFLSKTGRQKEAEDVLLEIKKKNPAERKYSQRLTESMIKSGKAEEEIQRVEKELHNGTNDLSIYAHLGDLYFHVDRLDDAITMFEEVIKNDDGPWYYLHMSRALVKKGQQESALSVLQTAVEKNPDVGWLLKEQGEVLFKLKNFEQAISKCRKAVRLDPFLGNAYVLLSQSYQALGKLDAALSAQLKAADVHPDYPWIQHRCGDLFLQVNQPEEAVKRFKIAIDIEPENAHFHNSLGNGFEQNGQIDLAARSKLKAAALAPDQSRIQHLCGDVLYKLGRHREALEKFQMAIKLEPDNAHFHVAVSHTHEALGQFKKALAAQLEAAEKDTSHPWIHHRCGHLLSRFKRYEEAVKEFQIAVSIEPDYTHFQNSLHHAKKAVKQEHNRAKKVNKAFHQIKNKLDHKYPFHLEDSNKEFHRYFPNTNYKSQIGQDYIVEHLFKRKKRGFFIEMGALDGKNLSNTYLLEKEYQWNGLCIEPQDEHFKNLIRNRHCICDNSCVDGEHRSVEFASFKGAEWVEGLAGIMGEDLDNNPDSTYFDQYQHDVSIKETVLFTDVLKKHDVPKVIDYLSLDVEGAEYRIMKDFPFNEYKFLYMNIERPPQKLVELLKENSYVCLGIHIFDTHFYHKDLLELW